MWTLKWTDDCAWTMVLSFSAIEPIVVGEMVGPRNDLPRDNLCRACALITYMYDSDLYGCTSRHGRCVVRFVTVGSVVDNVGLLVRMGCL